MLGTRIIGLVAAAVLCGCGGGGGGGSAPAPGAPAPAATPAAPSTPAVPASYTPLFAEVGDFTTVRYTTRITRGGKPDPEDYSGTQTRVVSKFFSNGPYEVVTTASSGFLQTEHWSRSGAVLLTKSPNCTTSYAPELLVVPTTLSVGLAFNYANKWEERCENFASRYSYLYSSTGQGSVLALERKTVPAGTFDALKIAQTGTNTNPSSTATDDTTCWRDTVVGMTIACTSLSTSGDTTLSTTLELVSYSSARSNTRKLDVIRFAGRWQGQFGNVYGDCVLTASALGVIGGNCKSATIAFTARGTIGNDGVVALTLSGQGTSDTFAGQAESPLKIEGRMPGRLGAGEWTLTHE